MTARRVTQSYQITRGGGRSTEELPACRRYLRRHYLGRDGSLRGNDFIL